MQNPFKKKQNLYRAVFGNEGGREVLSDLNIFCCGTRTTVGQDRDEILVNEGRRQVFLEIMTLLKVEFDEVYDEYIEDGF